MDGFLDKMLEDEIGAVQRDLAALLSAIGDLPSPWTLPADRREAAPVKARAADAIRSMQDLQEAFRVVGLTEGRGRL